jgi:CHAD domain-containing protein
MIHSIPACYILHGPAADKLALEGLGELAPSLLPRGETLPFSRLDCFDQSLRRSERLLLDLGTVLDLILPDGSVTSQPMQRGARFVADLPEGAVKPALTDISPLRSLLVCGAGTLNRALLAFVDEEEKVHCRAALLVLTGAEGQTLTLVTPQSLRGYDKALADLRRYLESHGTPLRMDNLYAQLFPGSPVPEARAKITVAADQTAYEAATSIIAHQIPLARQTEAGIIADHDTEFLHDYRVALRRIRSVLSLFKGTYEPGQTADLKARFSAVMAQTGQLRDLDVHLLEKQSYYGLLPVSLHDGLDTMFTMRAAERSKALARMSRYLRSGSYARDMADLARRFTTPQALIPGPEADKLAYAFACSLIWKRYRKIRQIAVVIGPKTDDTAVHALRIHCKKLRYLMEFFAGLFPGPALRSVLKPLKALQDHLGQVNDLSVQQVNLQTFLQGSDGWKDSTKLQVAQSVGALITVLHQRKLDERQKAMAAVAGFISPVTQKTFRALFRPQAHSHARAPSPSRTPNP